MSQNTIQQAVEDIQLLTKTHGGGLDVPLGKLLRPWLAITDLDFDDALARTAPELWEQLSKVHAGLSGYLAVMGTTPDPEQLQEAACRLMGSFEIAGTNIIEGDIDITQKMTINFDGGVWVYVTDPKLRTIGKTDKFQTALAAVREMLKS